MRARVTNMSRGARGFHTADGGTALLDPGASAVLDLAPHPAHDAWAAAGEVAVSLEGEAEPPAPRARPAARAAPSRGRDA
ncbi:hypothetical protein [Lichenibacterium minor]|uniref:hypothetical protein n=1 Tax=Lichenibacterium minor TaxID=2316528 RepID=UPI0013ECB1F1|nr:hypothetical protein [Lichenibacterium minor]